MAVLLPQRHEQARHQREVKRHVAFVAVAEVGGHVRRPQVRFGQQHPVGIARVQLAPKLAQHVVRLRQVRAGRAVALDQVRHGIEPHAVDALVEPEAHHARHGFAHRRVVEIQIRLMREEAVPVVLTGHRIPRPVRSLGVAEDDADAAVLLIRVAPHVEIAFRRPGLRPPRRLEPRVLIRRVVDDELGDDPQAARVRRVEKRAEVLQRAVARVHALVVRRCRSRRRGAATGRTAAARSW